MLYDKNANLSQRPFPNYVRAKSLQSFLPLCESMDGSPPVSSVHEILQAGVLK